MNTIEKECPACKQKKPCKIVDKKWEFTIFECPDCTLQFSSDMDTVNPNDPRIERGHPRRTDLIGSLLGWAQQSMLKMKIKEGGSILEVGCGTGDFVHAAKKIGYDTIGVDLDKTTVEAGRKYWKTDLLIPMSAHDYFVKNKGKKFDMVCAFAVLEHLMDPHQLMEEMKECLADDGYIIFEVPNNGPLQKIYRKTTRVLDYPPTHLTRWNKKALCKFIEQHGFIVEKRLTCTPTITDIVPDLARLHTPNFIQMKTAMRISDKIRWLLGPLDTLIQKFTTEGRTQMVIARKAQTKHTNL